MRRFSLSVLGIFLFGSSGLCQVDTNSEHFYLFTYFNDQAAGACLALSSDGMKWQLYDNAKPVIAPKIGSSPLMRDPMTWFDPATRTFHLVWTTAWEGTVIGYASSKDLKTWSAQTGIPVGAKISNCRNCWAPEIFHDDIKDSFMVFWSTESGSNGKRGYYVMTKDFNKFTDAVKFFDPGYTVIDECLLKTAESEYYLFFKDERESQTGRPAKNIHYVHGPTPQGPWSDVSNPITNVGCEGPTAIRIGNEYRVYFDPFTASGSAYRMVKTIDLDTSASPWPSGGTLKAGASGSSNFTYRHGHIIEIPREYAMWLLHNRPLPTTVASGRPFLPAAPDPAKRAAWFDLLGRSRAALAWPPKAETRSRSLPAGIFIEKTSGGESKPRILHGQ